MRVTNNMLISNMTYNLNNTMERLEKYQYETSTGKKFRVPSDDPIAASKSLKFNTDISKVNQYLRNAKDAGSWMKETESALVEIREVLHRTKELTVQAANSTNKADLDKIKDEITELKVHIIQVSNSTYAGRSLFTGYKTDGKLLDKDGEYLVSLGYATDKDGNLVDGDGNIVTDPNNAKKIDEVFTYNVGVAETVDVNILGNKVFGVSEYDGTTNKITDGPGYSERVVKGDSPHLINVFNQLEKALENEDGEKIQESLGNLDKSLEQVLSVTSEIGAKSNRLDLTISKLDDQVVSITELLSFNEDVSLPDAYMRLTMEETAYRASLSIGAKIIQPSLMDFLR